MPPVDKRALLKQHFLDTAFVKDAQKGYIVAKEFNLAIDPDVLQLASRSWADMCEHEAMDAIIGLPDAGARLVSQLADLLRVRQILPAKRSVQVPGAWEDVVSYSNGSFTMGSQEVVSHIGFVKPGMKVLLVDDVVAFGHTAVASITALQDAGVEVVGLCVLFDKQWQGGVARIVEKTKIPVYSLISIQSISQEGTITLL